MKPAIIRQSQARLEEAFVSGTGVEKSGPCQFYVDGRSGVVMQTPLTLANKRDRVGKANRNSVRIVISKELPASFRLPGKQPLTEQAFYALLFTFLTALMKTGVAVCGSGVVQPLAGRTEAVGSRN